MVMFRVPDKTELLPENIETQCGPIVPKVRISVNEEDAK